MGAIDKRIKAGYECEHTCQCDEILERRDKIPVYHTEEFGIELVLHNAAERVVCTKCEQEGISIPYMDKLVAAAAMVRIQLPVKLRGQDIRFFRKSIELTAAELARELEVTPETVSRWENDKAPIGATVEKLLRLMIAETFKKDAPMIDFSAADIFNLNVRACNSVDRRLIVHLEIVKVLEQDDCRDVYSIIKAAA